MLFGFHNNKKNNNNKTQKEEQSSALETANFLELDAQAMQFVSGAGGDIDHPIKLV